MGRQIGRYRGRIFVILKNTSGDLKSLNWGIKGHSSSPRCLESRLLIHKPKIRGQLTTHSLHPQSARGSWKSSGIRPISLRRCFSPVSLPQVFWNLSFELAESGREGAGSPSAILRRGCIAGGDWADWLSHWTEREWEDKAVKAPTAFLFSSPEQTSEPSKYSLHLWNTLVIHW